MKVLVTGAAGYIGSHVLFELLERNYDVIALDDYSNSDSSTYDAIKQVMPQVNLKIVEMDFADKRVEELLVSEKVEAVIHIAAKKQVPESIQRTLYYYKVNVKGSIKLLEMMERANVKKLIFSSSAAVYGQQTYVDETSPLTPDNPYGGSKAMFDNIVKDVGTNDKSWQMISLRYFNVVGAHPNGVLGEKSQLVTNLFPVIGRVMRGTQEKLLIFGNDWGTKDGFCVRDYIHVRDLALAHIMALEKIKPGFEAFCLSTGIGYSVMDVIQMWEKVSGREIAKQVVGRRPGDVESVTGNPAKANELLG